MAQSPFQRELLLDSVEASDRLGGDIYAVMDAPIADFKRVSSSPQRWCEILLLLSNTKSCIVGRQTDVPSLKIRFGTKGPQMLASTTPMDFSFETPSPQTDLQETLLSSDSGPMGTKDAKLWVRAIALGAEKSFVHLHYSYRTSLAGRLATGAYLQTLGLGKVGFSQELSVPSDDAQPKGERWVGGVRGIIERNTMRYFLGLSCALQFSNTNVPAQRFAKMASCWYEGSDRYSRQLYEMPVKDYLDMKRSEYARDASMQ
jgi:hypothetical protein